MSDGPNPSAVFAPDGDSDALIRQEEQQKLHEKMEMIVGRLSNLALEAVRGKAQIEARWLQNLREFHGKLDSTTEANLRSAEGQKSRNIINMTRPKTLAWEARLGDLLFPADEKNWGIGPTPVPELVAEANSAAEEAVRLHAEAAALTEQANADLQTGTQTGGGPGAALSRAEDAGRRAIEAEELEAKTRAIMDEAKKRSEAMANEMDDQLVQCEYAKQARKAIRQACRLGSGVMKGPLNGKRAPGWSQTTDDKTQKTVYSLKSSSGLSPSYRWTDSWNFFPDPNATDLGDSEYEFERHLWNKSQLRKKHKTIGFQEQAVIDLLKGGPGFGSDENFLHLAQIRGITGEGEAVTGRYVVWEYHGPLECEEVRTLVEATEGPEAAARFDEDYTELDEVRVIAWFCDNKLLKIEPDYVLDSQETLYSVYSFLKSDTTVMGGIGVPEAMTDPVRALHAAWRMLLDNGGLSTGPQVVVDKTKIEPENGSWKMEPRKVWQRTDSQDAPGDAKPFEVFNIDNNAEDLVRIVDLSLKFIDEMSSLPLIAQGEQGAHITQTAGGMSMLMNSANVIFRAAVKNFDDDMTTPNIRRLFHWNMQFNEKPEIKGDMQVEARGTSALLVREVQSANLLALATQWTAHPVLRLALKQYGYDAARMAVQSLSINPDDVLGSREDFEQAIKDEQQNAAQDPNVVRAQATLEAAKIVAASKTEDSETRLQIAEMNRETAIMELMQNGDMTRAQIEADVDKLVRSLQSKEREKAVDIAVEERRAARAKEEGQLSTAATGKEIG